MLFSLVDYRSLPMGNVRFNLPQLTLRYFGQSHGLEKCFANHLGCKSWLLRFDSGF